MSEISVRLLRPADDRRGFRSGDVDLDRFFVQFAGQNQFRHHLGVTYVATDERAIYGFLTVSPSTIEIDHVPARMLKKLPRYPLPVLRLARLATALDARGQGVGQLLLRTGLRIAQEMAKRVGCVGVVVDAKEGAQSYYEKLGFETIELLDGASGVRPRLTPMFLPLGKIPAAE